MTIRMIRMVREAEGTNPNPLLLPWAPQRLGRGVETLIPGVLARTPLERPFESLCCSADKAAALPHALDGLG